VFSFVSFGAQICHDEAIGVLVVRQTVNCNTRIIVLEHGNFVWWKRKRQTGDVHAVFVLRVMIGSFRMNLGWK